MDSSVDEQARRERRDALLLAHVNLYQLTLPSVARRLFFPAAIYPQRDEAKKRCGDMLSALVRAKKISKHIFSSGESYYTLAGKRSGNTQAIEYDLGTLWLCCMESKRFHRLSTAELRGLFATPPHHHIRHCVSEEDGGPVVYRLYFSTADVKSTVLQSRRHLTEARNKHGLRLWVESGDYGFIVCSESEQKSQDIADALQRSTAGGGSLHDQARFLVATVPTSATVQASDE